MNVQSSIQLMQSLKLHGMASAYEAISQLPLDKQPDQHQCVATLMDAEQQHRAFKKTNMFLKLSKLKYQANLKDIIFSSERNLDKNTIAALSDCSFIKRGHNLIITGATGCGKSYLASAIGHQACLMGYRTLYFNMNRLCDQIAVAKLDGSFIRWINNVQRAHLLILDDFGLQPISQQVKLALLQILEDRYASASTVIAAQLPLDKWYDYFNDPTIADAILDRLSADCSKILLKGKSLRTPKS